MIPSDYCIDIKTYPNPFNSNVTFSVSSPSTNIITIEIFDILGRLSKCLAIPAGDIAIDWDGSDSQDHPVSSGIYFARVKSEDIVVTKKPVYLR